MAGQYQEKQNMSAFLLGLEENELAVVVSGEGNVPSLSSNHQIPPGSSNSQIPPGSRTCGTENRTVAQTGTRRSCKRRKLSHERDWQIVDLPSDIVYVRSMPGKATDPHSLRERERRRAFTEKMNYLKSIVPGCLEVSQQLGVINHVIDYIKHMEDKVMDLSEQIAFSESFSTPSNPEICNPIPSHTYSTSACSGMLSRRPSEFSVMPHQGHIIMLPGIPENGSAPQNNATVAWQPWNSSVQYP